VSPLCLPVMSLAFTISLTEQYWTIDQFGFKELTSHLLVGQSRLCRVKIGLWSLSLVIVYFYIDCYRQKGHLRFTLTTQLRNLIAGVFVRKSSTLHQIASTNGIFPSF
jgi:hypothetical protein